MNQFSNNIFDVFIRYSLLLPLFAIINCVICLISSSPKMIDRWKFYSLISLDDDSNKLFFYCKTCTAIVNRYALYQADVWVLLLPRYSRNDVCPVLLQWLQWLLNSNSGYYCCCCCCGQSDTGACMCVVRRSGKRLLPACPWRYRQPLIRGDRGEPSAISQRWPRGCCGIDSTPGQQLQYRPTSVELGDVVTWTIQHRPADPSSSPLVRLRQSPTAAAFTVAFNAAAAVTWCMLGHTGRWPGFSQWRLGFDWQPPSVRVTTSLIFLSQHAHVFYSHLTQQQLSIKHRNASFVSYTKCQL